MRSEGYVGNVKLNLLLTVPRQCVCCVSLCCMLLMSFWCNIHLMWLQPIFISVYVADFHILAIGPRHLNNAADDWSKV